MALGLLIASALSNLNLVAESRQHIEEVPELIERFSSDPNVTPEQLQNLRSTLEGSAEIHRTRLQRLRVLLSPKHLYAIVFGFFGSVAGVSLSILVAATAGGAEFRWTYWKTMFLYEPRRERIVLAKFMVLWVALFAGLFLITILSYVSYAGLSRLYHFDVANQWASPSEVLTLGIKAWLGLTCYASISAAMAIVTRTSLGGAAAASGLILADAVITPRLQALRYVLPGQQIATLLRNVPDAYGLVGKSWLPTIHRVTELEAGLATVSPKEVQANVEAAIAVLIGWTVLAVILAVVTVRLRDAPT